MFGWTRRRAIPSSSEERYAGRFSMSLLDIFMERGVSVIELFPEKQSYRLLL